MKISHAKAIFIWGTAVSLVIFLALTYDSHKSFRERTHEEKLNAQVAAGKWVWQKYNCNDCHTILGIGGYYAPDVTKVMGYRDADWLTRFLKDPHAVWPAARQMPNLHLKTQEIADLIAFLSWVNEIDTNNWPPKPLEVAGSGKPKPGEAIFRAQGCPACHAINGVGGNVGPDLSRVGARRGHEWLEEQLKDPKTHNPNSVMPSYAKLPKSDRDELVDYLSDLR